MKTGYSGNRTQRFYVRKSSWDWVLVGQPCAACLAAVYAEVGDAPDAVCLDPLLDLCMLQGRLAVQWNKSTAKEPSEESPTTQLHTEEGCCHRAVCPNATCRHFSKMHNSRKSNEHPSLPCRKRSPAYTPGCLLSCTDWSRPSCRPHTKAHSSQPQAACQLASPAGPFQRQPCCPAHTTSPAHADVSTRWRQHKARVLCGMLAAAGV